MIEAGGDIGGHHPAAIGEQRIWPDRQLKTSAFWRQDRRQRQRANQSVVDRRVEQGGRGEQPYPDGIGGRTEQVRSLRPFRQRHPRVAVGGGLGLGACGPKLGAGDCRRARHQRTAAEHPGTMPCHDTPRADQASTSSRAAINSSTWASCQMNGGSSRITVEPAGRVSTPRS